MSQTLDPVPSHEAKRAVLCTYVNATSKIQVARIRNIPNWYFERVVFPGQHLTFEAMPEAYLEIHCGMMASAILSDRIPCHRLAEGAEQERPLEFYNAAAEQESVEPEAAVESSMSSRSQPPQRTEPLQPKQSVPEAFSEPLSEARAELRPSITASSVSSSDLVEGELAPL